MTKNIKEEINFTITTGKTSSTAVLGPLLGQRAIKLNEFREKFTKLTENIKDDTTVSVKLIVLFNKKFEIRLNNIPTTTFIKKTFSLTKCSKQAKHQTSAFVDLRYIYEYAKARKNHQNLPLDSICRTISSSLKSSGILFSK